MNHDCSTQPQKNTDVNKGMLPWEGFPKQTCINHILRKQGCKLMDQIWTVQPFCASLGRSLCHGNEHQGIDANILSSGHHDCSTKGCLSLHSCQTAILPHVVTLNSAYFAFSTFQSAFIWAISFSGSMKFFQLKITLGLALGESWLLLCANVQCLSLRYFAGRLSRGFTGFWHLMTDEITNQTLEVLTDARMLAVWTQHSNTFEIHG